MQREEGEVSRHKRSKHKRKHSRSRSHHKSRKHHEKKRSRERTQKPAQPADDPTILKENQLIDQFFQQEEELAQKRCQREELLKKYRLPDREHYSDESEGESPVKVLLMEGQQLDIDVSRQNYLKMLESLRDSK